MIDDLCFLLRSPLFLYAIAPRLRRATNAMRSDPGLRADPHKKATHINISLLSMKIAWNGNSWATRLLYGEASLIEGRKFNTTQKAGFNQSFHWFCEEARFLSCEFHAREHAATVALGTAVVAEPTEMEVGQTRAKSGGRKQRRVVKLKIRYRMAHGRPVLTKKAR
jgi:hypothetical protein